MSVMDSEGKLGHSRINRNQPELIPRSCTWVKLVY